MEKLIKSYYSDVKTPEATSLPQFVFDRVAEHGDKVAMVDARNGRSMTYREFLMSYRYVRCGLYKHGVVKDDVVLVMLPNSLDYPIIFHAILSLGGVVSASWNSASTEEISRQIIGSGACHVFTTPESLPKIRDAVPANHFMKSCFVIGKAEGCISYEDILKDDASEYPVTIFNVRKDLALLPYSSGTTGCPKPVKLTHYCMVYHMCQLMHPDLCFLTKEDVLLNILSMSHQFAAIVFLNMAFISGTTSILVERRNTNKFIEALHKYKPTVLHLIPPVADELVRRAVSSSALASVHTITSTASILHPELVRKLKNVLPVGANIREIYGMTECGVVTMSPVKGSPPGSVGRLIPNISAKVIHQEDGHDCGPGEPGELLIKGAQTTGGYLRLPEVTSSTITEDGWLHTGDIVKYDTDRYFYFIDRLKDIIKYEGLQVPPAELECLLKSHPAVADAAVIGKPAEVVGEVPKAFVVKKQNAQVTEEELVRYIGDQVSPEKQLRGGVEFIGSIPKLGFGKVLRHRLRTEEIEKQEGQHLLLDICGNPRHAGTTDEVGQQVEGRDGLNTETFKPEDMQVHTPPPTKKLKYNSRDV